MKKFAIINHLPNDDKALINSTTFNQIKNQLSTAFFRYKVAPLAESILSAGADFDVINTKHENDAINRITEHPYDACFIGKLLETSLEGERQLEKTILTCVARLTRKGTPIHLLLSDNHIDNRCTQKDLYRDLIFLSKTIISPSKTLLNAASNYCKESCQLLYIPDPWQFNKQDSPRHNSGTCKIIWFGQGINLFYLLREIEGIITSCNAAEKFELTILTREEYFKKNIIPKLQEISSSFSAHSIPKPWRIRLKKWDDSNQPEQLRSELKKSHISLIPSDPKDPLKNCASSNRLVDSIQAGCVCVTSPIDSYLPHSRISLQGDKFPEMIDYAWKNFSKLSKTNIQHSEEELREYNPESIKESWDNFLASN